MIVARNRPFFASVAAIGLLCVNPASAQTTDESPEVVKALSRCRAVPQPDARLACYDAAMVDLQTAVASGQLKILDREGLQRTKRALFGFQLPSIGLFGRDDRQPDFQEISTTVARVVPLGYGKYEFVLNDGARWQTTDAMNQTPRSGSKIRIRKAAMGSYFINIDGARGVKGRRTS